MSGAGYKTDFLPGGGVVQSAVRTSAKLPESIRGTPLGWMAEAIVLAVYFPEEETRAWGKNGVQKAITCDLRLLGMRPGYLYRVPVLQPQQSLHDEDIWVPRAASQDITGGQLAVAAQGDTKQKVTAAEDTDADHVLVSFLENSPRQPVILPIQFPHVGTRRTITKAAGRVRRIRHHGVSMEWDKNGNWSLDATGAAKEALGTKGAEVPNNGTGGRVQLKTKDGGGSTSYVTLKTNGDVEVIDGGGSYIKLRKSVDEINMATGTLDVSASKDITLIAIGNANLDGAKVLLGDATLAATEGLVKGTSWQTARQAQLQGVATARAAYITAGQVFAAFLTPGLSVLYAIPIVGPILFWLIAGPFFYAYVQAEVTFQTAQAGLDTTYQSAVQLAVSKVAFTE